MKQKILLVTSWVATCVFFLLSISSLYTDAVIDGVDIGQTVTTQTFHTPWFSWSVDPSVVYIITACLCLITARVTYHVFSKEKDTDYLYYERM